MNKLLAMVSMSVGMNLLLNGVVALPIWLLWTVGGLSHYFVFLPSAWQSVPFLHIVGVLWLFTLLKGVFQGVTLTAKV